MNFVCAHELSGYTVPTYEEEHGKRECPLERNVMWIYLFVEKVQVDVKQNVPVKRTNPVEYVTNICR